MDTPVQDGRLVEQARRMQSILVTLARPPEESPLSDVELSHREIRALIALGEKGELTMTELAGEVRAPLSTSTRMVDRLVRKGLVGRVRSEADRRMVVVRATEMTMGIRETIYRNRYEMAREMLGRLTVGERAILLELMEKMMEGGPGGGDAGINGQSS